MPVFGSFTVGQSTAFCASAGVLGTNMIARVGNADFALHATGGAANGASRYLLAARPSTQALKILGLDIWLDIATLVSTLPAATNALGDARLALPIPNQQSLSGVNVAMQTLHIDASCTQSNLATTPALTFQISLKKLLADLKA